MGSSVKVLGTGCTKCSELYHNTVQAMNNLGIDEDIEMVTNDNDIINYGVAVTPALVLDDMVWTSGDVPSVEGLEEIFRKRESMRKGSSR
ncbi:MAG: thioredoxin family protein [Candidatus Aegiribacteria sp.]